MSKETKRQKREGLRKAIDWKALYQMGEKLPQGLS